MLTINNLIGFGAKRGGRFGSTYSYVNPANTNHSKKVLGDNGDLYFLEWYFNGGRDVKLIKLSAATGEVEWVKSHYLASVNGNTGVWGKYIEISYGYGYIYIYYYTNTSAPYVDLDTSIGYLKIDEATGEVVDQVSIFPNSSKLSVQVDSSVKFGNMIVFPSGAVIFPFSGQMGAGGTAISGMFIRYETGAIQVRQFSTGGGSSDNPWIYKTSDTSFVIDRRDHFLYYTLGSSSVSVTDQRQHSGARGWSALDSRGYCTDSSGNHFIADNHSYYDSMTRYIISVWKLSPDFKTALGSTHFAIGSATAAYYPYGMGVDADDNIYVSFNGGLYPNYYGGIVKYDNSLNLLDSIKTDNYKDRNLQPVPYLSSNNGRISFSIFASDASLANKRYGFFKFSSLDDFITPYYYGEATYINPSGQAIYINPGAYADVWFLESSTLADSGTGGFLTQTTVWNQTDSSEALIYNDVIQ